MTAGWQDIATAPRDGTRLIVGWDGRGETEPYAEVGYCYRRAYGHSWRNDEGRTFTEKPTHWQPLPHPPSFLAETAKNSEG